ncbi:MAG TPA: GNAT family N-acetyltransferase [Alphaproteobacteria bacterium]|nr:GNAT family N-acetyltransferase [Alphaproteobacteria bacterium]
MTADTLRADTIRIAALDRAGLERALDSLAEILHACVHDGASVGFVLPFTREAARAFWRETVAPGVAAGTRILLVAEHGGEVAGTVQLGLGTMPNQRHRAEIAKLLVHPRHRRRGIGRALMLEAEQAARCHGRALITLDTKTGDAAEPLYLALGYELAGRIPGYARDTREPGRFDATSVMYKTLRD